MCIFYIHIRYRQLNVRYWKINILFLMQHLTLWLYEQQSSTDETNRAKE